LSYPSPINYPKPDDYLARFERVYCKKPSLTFDGIPVSFQKKDFSHAFYERENPTGPKKIFSKERAERMDWIGEALLDKSVELYYGWDNKKKRFDKDRRVAIVNSNYVVIIEIYKSGKASFKTAYVGSTSTLTKIRKGKKWGAS